MSLTLDKVIHEVISARHSKEYVSGKPNNYYLSNSIVISQVRKNDNFYNFVHYQGDLVYLGETKDEINFERKRFTSGKWTNKIAKKHIKRFSN